MPGTAKGTRIMCPCRRSFTEYGEQSIAIESQAEPVSHRKFDQLLLPIFVVSRADAFQVLFEKRAVFVLVTKAILACAEHRALHLLRKRCWCFCHLTLSRRRHLIALPVCWRLHCKICDASRTLRESAERGSGRRYAQTNFCKGKGKECGAEKRSAPY